MLERIAILRINNLSEISIKIINVHQGEIRVVIGTSGRFNEYFYSGKNHYITALKNENTLCLCQLNEDDQLIPIICDLSKDDYLGYKCTVIVHPRISGVIYVNLISCDNQTKTHISFDNGKSFQPLELEQSTFKCPITHCWIVLDLICNHDLNQLHFKEMSIVLFKGTYHRYGSTTRNFFVSFNDGKSWKILDSRIDDIVIFNEGRLMFGQERKNAIIWYSYDMGDTWFNGNNGADCFIGGFEIEYTNYNLIGALNYKKQTDNYTYVLYNFSKETSRFI
ncbi:hypothetical protein RF11_00586 [Thelohanellus kitauei]|uniref:Vacuolar protein sorting/targeting protein 10 n=1 Tax=Thelohanellus kitauei TaxID=669202 RepID=A0A0C2JQV3_THEKT|nr:hypothetical protein RF11_00586 [Thelohanellus kitauei]